MKKLSVVLMILAITLGGALVAPSRALAGELPVGEVELVASFDPAAVTEGIAVDKRGNIFVSDLGPPFSPSSGQVIKISPEGNQSVFCQVTPPGAFAPAGLAVDSPGNVYATAPTFNPATSGVYRISRDGETCERIPGTESILFANALAFDKRGNLYVTESIESAIYRISRRGDVELWLQFGPGDGVAPAPFLPFPNGIQYWKGALIVADSNGGLLRVPVQKKGAAGTPELFADLFAAGAFFPDGIALDVHGDIYVADLGGDQLLRVSADGSTVDVLADTDDLLDLPTAVAFGTGKGDRKNLFVVNSDFDLNGPEGASVVKVGTGVPGNPLP